MYILTTTPFDAIVPSISAKSPAVVTDPAASAFGDHVGDTAVVTVPAVVISECGVTASEVTAVGTVEPELTG
jgi:hypothetical protein